MDDLEALQFVCFYMYIILGLSGRDRSLDTTMKFIDSIAYARLNGRRLLEEPESWR